MFPFNPNHFGISMKRSPLLTMPFVESYIRIYLKITLDFMHIFYAYPYIYFIWSNSYENYS
jgi:uncharacterized membrane protein